MQFAWISNEKLAWEKTTSLFIKEKPTCEYGFSSEVALGSDRAACCCCCARRAWHQETNMFSKDSVVSYDVIGMNGYGHET
jgi:hypothetical protein